MSIRCFSRGETNRDDTGRPLRSIYETGRCEGTILTFVTFPSKTKPANLSLPLCVCIRLGFFEANTAAILLEGNSATAAPFCRAVFNANRETHDRVSRFTNGIGFLCLSERRSDLSCRVWDRVWKLIEIFYVKIS